MSTARHYVTSTMMAGVLGDVLQRTGLYLPDRPEGEIPTLPADVTDLGDEDLMQSYTSFVAWTDYAASQLAVAAVEEKEQTRQHDLTKAKSVAAAGKGTVTSARAAAEEVAAEEGERAVRQYAYRKVLEAIATNLERDAALMSRELSRRLGEKNTSQVTRARRWVT